MRLRPYTEGVYIPFGVFVGNVNTLRITDNDIGRGGGVWYPQAVRVWGFLGQFILCAGNRVGLATLGFRIKDISFRGVERNTVLWTLRDNLVTGNGANVRLHQTNPSNIVYLEENVEMRDDFVL